MVSRMSQRSLSSLLPCSIWQPVRPLGKDLLCQKTGRMIRRRFDESKQRRTQEGRLWWSLIKRICRFNCINLYTRLKYAAVINNMVPWFPTIMDQLLKELLTYSVVKDHKEKKKQPKKKRNKNTKWSERDKDVWFVCKTTQRKTNDHWQENTPCQKNIKTHEIWQ